MRNLKKLLALVLALMMAMSLMVTVHADYIEDYTDRSEVKRYGDSVDFLNGLKVFQGYEDGSFKPAKPISRAEVTAIIYRIMTGDVEGAQVKVYADYPNGFSDVPQDIWYEGYVNYCANGLYVHGDPDGKFRPDDNITGYEVLAIVLRALGYGEKGEFEGQGWETRTATTAKRLGITDRLVETLSKDATREVVAEILFQTLNTETVTYTYTYEKNVLVEDTNTNRRNYRNEGYDGDFPICETLLYRTFQIVGKYDGYDRDPFGRPAEVWVKDDPSDTIVNGRKYHADDANDYADVEAFTLNLKAVKTYYVEKTECDVAKEVNDDKSLTGVSEWLNGAQAYYGFKVDDEGNPTTEEILTRKLDALHTTVETIGAQGRTTEIYKVDGGWNIIYIDTLLGVIKEIIPRTYDTNKHVYQAATMKIDVNGAVKVEYSDTTSDFEEYEEGQEILINTYGQSTAVVDAGGTVTHPDYFDATGDAGQKLKAVPYRNDNADKISDFRNEVANDAGAYSLDDWTVELAGTPETKDITVGGTKGKAEDKTGVISTNKEEVLSSNVFHEETGVVDTYVAAKYVPAGYTDKLTNNLMNRNVKLFLFVAPDGTESIVGMTQSGAESGIGVITALEPVRASVGNWVMEVTVFTAKNESKTLKLMTWKNGGWSYINSADPGVNVKDAADNVNAARWNRLIQWTPVASVNGVTLYGVTAVGVPEEDNTDLKDTNNQEIAGVLVQAGVADTLRTTSITGSELDDNSQFIFAGTTFDYSLKPGENTGEFVLGGLVGYDKGFRTIPTVYGNKGDAMVQRIGSTYYVYPKLVSTEDAQSSGIYNDVASIVDGVKYSYVAQPGIVVDASCLVLSTVATYPDHATYKVLTNGKVEDLDVANINDGTGGLNALIERAMEYNELIRVTGRNAALHATAITFVDQDYNLGLCDAATSGNSSNTLHSLTLLKDSAVDDSYDAGSKAWTPAGTAKTATIEDEDTTKVTIDGGVMRLESVADSTKVEYLTLDNDCQVQIVNLATGNVTEGTLNSIKQYRNPTTSGDTDKASHELVFELNAYGYVCNIYIID